MSKVACVKINQKTVDPEVIFQAVKRAMELISWDKLVKSGSLVLKVNAVWDRLYPSCTTTPMVIEGVLKVVLSSKKFRPENITIADTDTAAIMHADKSFRVQGIELLAKRYHVNIVNLTTTEFREVSFKGKVLTKLKISKVLLDADNIITLPVLKTHSYSTITGGLKNQWGCIHDLRHNYHLVLHQAIADVNNFFKNKMRFALMDGVFGMEGKGPKTGSPREVGYVFASSDLVSLDTAVSSVMGFDGKIIKHIKFAEESGIGSTKFTVVGDVLPKFHFEPASSSNIVMGTEMWLRHLGPKVEWIMFNSQSPILTFLRWSAKIYYDLWYWIIGIKYAKKMMATNFGKIWSKRYLNA